jgi:hypothetical protein
LRETVCELEVAARRCPETLPTVVAAFAFAVHRVERIGAPDVGMEIDPP